MTTVLLVHGAFHGAWCWERVTRGLDGLGIAHRAIDLPGHGRCAGRAGTLAEDAVALEEAIHAAEGPVIVCAHSFGGSVVTEGAPKDPKIARLVYLAAFAPDAGESVLDLLGPDAALELSEALGESGIDGLHMDEARAVARFYHDCTPEDVAWALERLGPESPTAMAAPVTCTAWRDHATTYVVCEDDRTIPCAVQERMAQRCDEVVRWPTGHSPMLNRPDLVVELLRDLVDRLEASR